MNKDGNLKAAKPIVRSEHRWSGYGLLISSLEIKLNISAAAHVFYASRQMPEGKASDWILSVSPLEKKRQLIREICKWTLSMLEEQYTYTYARKYARICT